MSLLLPGFRASTGWCRVCQKPLHGTDEQNVRHWRTCGQQHYADEYVQLHAFDVLNPADPEWADFVQHDPRYKPDTHRVDKGY